MNTFSMLNIKWTLLSVCQTAKGTQSAVECAEELEQMQNGGIIDIRGVMCN